MENKVKYLPTLAALAAATSLWSVPASAVNVRTFNMVPSSSSCVPHATARVTVALRDGFESLHLEASGLPAGKTFTFFVIQVPKAPFGMAWYQGDVTTNAQGVAVGDFAGRFSIEDFVVAQEPAPAPKVHAADATSNPATAPIHMYHLGMWFDSFADAREAGCPDNVTPFNGDHTAGVQVLNTSNFADRNGPLRALQ
jgi:hypothetical protein